MMKVLRSRWLLIFCLVILLYPHPTEAQFIQDVNPAVVKIVAQVNGKTKVGTGMIVRIESDSAYIVTASHVVEGDPSHMC